MPAARASRLIGLSAALFAALAWSLNFIVPFVIGEYSVFDFALLRFVLSGVLAIAFLASRREAASLLQPADWLMAFWLGIIGYLGYFLALVGAAFYAGPVVAPAFLGIVPIVLAICGNLRQRTVPWLSLAAPLVLATAGLVLVHVHSRHAGAAEPIRSLFIGVPLAIAAVVFWTWFGLLNQSALAKRPGMDAGVWTALIMVGAGLGMLAFMPFGLAMGVFRLAKIGFGWHVAHPLYLWGIGLTLLSLIGGALAWTIAAQRLPVALSAQLIVMEAVFGTVLGLLVHQRWPSVAEVLGMVLLVAGVLAAIRAFQGHDAGMNAAVSVPDH
jgi:drug/metabolite transporter (DMT)-like permease